MGERRRGRDFIAAARIIDRELSPRREPGNPVLAELIKV